MDNRSVAEDRLAQEKRKEASDQAKANRIKAQEAASNAPPGEEDTTVLDNLLEKLRKGENPRRARRARPGERPAVPISLDIDTSSTAGPGADTADLARDMLARLKSDGFEAFPPSSPLPGQSSSTRRPRRTRGSNVSKLELDFSDGPQSPPPGSATIQEEEADIPPTPSARGAGHPPPEEEEWDRTIIAAVT